MRACIAYPKTVVALQCGAGTLLHHARPLRYVTQPVWTMDIYQWLMVVVLERARVCGYTQMLCYTDTSQPLICATTSPPPICIHIGKATRRTNPPTGFRQMYLELKEMLSHTFDGPR